MKMELNLLYLELLKFPNSPKIYRELKDYYLKEGKPSESRAFANLLTARFNELPNLNDHSPNPNTKQ